MAAAYRAAGIGAKAYENCGVLEINDTVAVKIARISGTYLLAEGLKNRDEVKNINLTVAIHVTSQRSGTNHKIHC